MRELTAEEIRHSFVNVEPADAQRIPLPGLHEVVWQDREFLGWRDPSLSTRGYLVHEADGEPIGIVLRFPVSSPRAGVPAMCSLCHSTQPATQVSLASAPRASLDGGSIGTYLCDDLGCSHKIRMLPASSPWAIGSGDLLESRSAGLIERVRGFTRDVAGV